MEQVLERLKEIWGKQNMTAKALIVGLPLLIIIVGVASIALLSRQPVEMAVLVTDTEQGDARKVVEELTKQGVDYQLKNDGRDIYVPLSEVDHLKLDVAGLPLTGSHMGFEIFDKPKWGSTQTELEIDYLRARQGELARIIETNPAVESAAVMLNLAPETSFVDHGEVSSASVNLVLASNGSLSPGQVKGIAQLVSMAVPKLKPADVSITDQNQNLLSGDNSMAGMAGNNENLKYKSQVEQDLKKKIVEVLTAYGPGRVVATVTVDMDFSSRQVQKENYTPVVGESGIERSIHETREKNKNVAGDPGGPPGTTPNTPGYKGIDGEAGTNGSETSKSDTTVEYEINKEVSDAVIPPGEIKRISASVAIDTDTWEPETKKGIEEQIAAAIGANPKRGDKVIAMGYVFDASARVASAEASAQSAKAASSAARGQVVRNVASWGIALLMIALLSVLLRSLVNQLAPREPLLAGLGDLGRGGVELDHELGGADDGFVLKHLDDMADSQTQKMRSEIERLIDTRPDVVAGLVRNWLLED